MRPFYSIIVYLVPVLQNWTFCWKGRWRRVTSTYGHSVETHNWYLGLRYFFLLQQSSSYLCQSLVLGIPWYWPQIVFFSPPKSQWSWGPSSSLWYTKRWRAQSKPEGLAVIFTVCYERRGEKGWMGGVKKKKKKTLEWEKEGDRGVVAMVTEIWLLFKNLECRWRWDECMCLFFFFASPHLSLSVVLWMCLFSFDFTADWNAIRACFFLWRGGGWWPEADVSGHDVEHRRLVWNVG